MRKPLATKRPEILRTERTAGPSPEMRLGSVRKAGTLTLHRQVFGMWGSLEKGMERWEEGRATLSRSLFLTQ